MRTNTLRALLHGVARHPGAIAKVLETGLLGLGLLAGLTACQQEPPKPLPPDPDYSFIPEGQIRDFDRIAAMQAAAGAAEDATLYACHFSSGGQLNALGRDKIGLILMAYDRPAAVYVDVPASDAQASARRSAVEHYLADASAGGIAVKAGYNPATLHPAPAPKDLAKTEGGSAASIPQSTGAQPAFTPAPQAKP